VDLRRIYILVRLWSRQPLIYIGRCGTIQAYVQNGCDSLSEQYSPNNIQSANYTDDTALGYDAYVHHR